MEQQIISGMGQVGTAILNLVPSKRLHRIHSYDIIDDHTPKIDNLEGLHICFPYSPFFFDAVTVNLEDFEPEILFIHSTVPPGTTATIAGKIDIPVIYTPIRGQHDNLLVDLRRYKKWITSYHRPDLTKAKDILKEMGFNVSVRAMTPEQLELIKLLDTTQYAVLIAWAQEADRFCKKYNVTLKPLREFGSETQELYNVRPNIRPGYIGGHCLIPNVKLLQQIKESSILDFINKSNEIVNKEIQREPK